MDFDTEGLELCSPEAPTQGGLRYLHGDITDRILSCVHTVHRAFGPLRRSCWAIGEECIPLK